MKAHFAFHLKIKVLESEGTVARHRTTELKMFEVQCEVSEVCDVFWGGGYDVG